MEIPVDILTTVLENLLDNARNKRSREPKLKIFVNMSGKDDHLYLSVTDTGSAIKPDIASQLFREVVSSNDGFGIGLYQSYELAKNHGVDLKIDENQDGQVTFGLRKSYGGKTPA
jgi:sensor histidine kinase regulating citrate/malate metabolism